MNETNQTPDDDKALALYYAYAALIKTLQDDKVLNEDHLFKNLAKQHGQLEKSGCTAAAEFLDWMADALARRKSPGQP